MIIKNLDLDLDLGGGGGVGWIRIKQKALWARKKNTMFKKIYRKKLMVLFDSGTNFLTEDPIHTLRTKYCSSSLTNFVQKPYSIWNTDN